MAGEVQSVTMLARVVAFRVFRLLPTQVGIHGSNHHRLHDNLLCRWHRPWFGSRINQSVHSRSQNMEEGIVHRERRILLCTSPVVVRQHWTDIDKQCVLCCKSHSLTYPSALLYHLYRFQLRCHLRSLETNTRSRDTIGCNPLPVCSFWAEIHGATTTSQEIYSSQPSKRIITFHRFMHTT